MYSCIDGADMGLGLLPDPVSCRIMPVGEHPFILGRSRCWRKSELDGYWPQNTRVVIEQNCSGRVSLPVRQGVDLIDKRQKHVVIIKYEQSLLLHCLHSWKYTGKVNTFVTKGNTAIAEWRQIHLFYAHAFEFLLNQFLCKCRLGWTVYSWVQFADDRKFLRENRIKARRPVKLKG